MRLLVASLVLHFLYLKLLPTLILVFSKVLLGGDSPRFACHAHLQPHQAPPCTVLACCSASPLALQAHSDFSTQIIHILVIAPLSLDMNCLHVGSQLPNSFAKPLGEMSKGIQIAFLLMQDGAGGLGREKPDKVL